jgi:UDP-glucuronate 4-epimerase
VGPVDGEKILITGATGKIAFPIARELAKRNEVWGAARFSKPGDDRRLEAAGVRALKLDMSGGDFSSVPACVRTNAHHSGKLLHHCRRSKGFVYCSTGSIYKYQGHRPLAESDGPGVPDRANYSFSKIAGEAVCSWVAEQFEVPLTIIRICSTYGPLGGAPADRLELILQRKPIPLHPDKPSNFNPIYEDDYVDLGIRAMQVAALPPVVVNWAGSETVSAEDYCAYLGQLVGIEPIFEYTPNAHTALWPDVTYMHEILGHTQVHWRDGFRRMLAARHPELAQSGAGR